MSNKIVERIVRQSGVANLLELLSRDLEPTDLQSLLLAVFKNRAEQQTPRRLLEQFESNRFLHAAAVNARAILELDQLALGLLGEAFEFVELSPLAPLGVCSALGPVDQNRVVTTIRNSEVVSDSTNALALLCASQRRALLRQQAGSAEIVRVCASHRLVRAQQFSNPNASAHFRLFAVCTAGRASNSADFEIASLLEHLTFYLRLLEELKARGYKMAETRIVFTPLDGEAAQRLLEQQVIAPLALRFPATRMEVDANSATKRGYYQWVRFQIYASNAQGAEENLGDGGFTDWTAQILSDKRERLLTSCISNERIIGLFAPQG